jgi:hypothetical protein
VSRIHEDPTKMPPCKSEGDVVRTFMEPHELPPEFKPPVGLRKTPWSVKNTPNEN